MSYRRRLKPRFYMNTLAHLAARGVTGLVSLEAGSLNTGSNINYLIDSRPRVRASFDTSANATTHLVFAFDLGDTTQTLSYVALLNHNLYTGDSNVRVAHHTSAITGAGQGTEVSSFAKIVGEYDEIGGQVTSDGSHIFSFAAVSGKRYWVVEIEDFASFSATDIEIGQICLGQYWTAPHGPDIGVERPTSYAGVSIKETDGGERHATAGWLSGSDGQDAPFGQPFRTEQTSGGGLAQHQVRGGRRRETLNLSYMADTNVEASDDSDGIGSTLVLRDVIDLAGGRFNPFIFTANSTSGTLGDYMWARFASDPTPQEIAFNMMNVTLEVEEDF